MSSLPSQVGGTRDLDTLSPRELRDEFHTWLTSLADVFDNLDRRLAEGGSILQHDCRAVRNLARGLAASVVALSPEQAERLVVSHAGLKKLVWGGELWVSGRGEEEDGRVYIDLSSYSSTVFSKVLCCVGSCFSNSPSDWTPHLRRRDDGRSQPMTLRLFDPVRPPRKIAEPSKPPWRSLLSRLLGPALG